MVIFMPAQSVFPPGLLQTSEHSVSRVVVAFPLLISLSVDACLWPGWFLE